MPAARHWATASRTPARSGSDRPIRPSSSALVDLSAFRRGVRPGDTENAHASCGHGLGGLFQSLLGGEVQSAQACDRLGCALGRSDEQPAFVGYLPYVRHCQQVGAQSVRVDESPILRIASHYAGCGLMKCDLHRIDRDGRAGESAVAEQLVEPLVSWGLRKFSGLAFGHPELGGDHTVLRQRAGLVGAEDCGRAHRLDGRRAPGEHANLRDTPGAHGEKDREDNGKFFREQRHSNGDSGEQGVEPSAPNEPIKQEDEYGDGEAADRRETDDPCGLLLQAWSLGLQHGERAPDLADPGARAGGGDARQSAPMCQDSAGIDLRLIVAAGFGCHGIILNSRALAHRHRLPGQKGLVALDLARLQQKAIRRDPVTLFEDEKVAFHHIAAGNLYRHPIPNDERAGSR